MPKRDTYHDAVREALIKDGWTITHDPLVLTYGERAVFVDLGAEGPLGAEKAGRKIAIEVKSFTGPSVVTALEQSLGQFRFYRFLLTRQEPDRILYLGVPADAYASAFQKPEGGDLIESEDLRILVFDPLKGAVSQWIR